MDGVAHGPSPKWRLVGEVYSLACVISRGKKSLNRPESRPKLPLAICRTPEARHLPTTTSQSKGRCFIQGEKIDADEFSRHLALSLVTIHPEER